MSKNQIWKMTIFSIHIFEDSIGTLVTWIFYN